MGDNERPTLDINFTCLYGDYKNDKEILDLMTRVQQSEQFIRDHLGNKLCTTLFERIDNKGNIWSFSPTIIIRSGPVVIGFADVDLSSSNTAILEHICAIKGYGSIALAIAENVILTPCDELKEYYTIRDNIQYVHKVPSVIYLEDIIKTGFYEKCGYKNSESNDRKNTKSMEKNANNEYANRLAEFLEIENIYYEDIATFYKMIDIKSYTPIQFDWIKG